ncbi:MAG: prolipoprotein diacylglyceryl transferase [Clostridia bacterium]|nr:prolipoprotein diacylglyceryl transferase [Clostridia bacterium]
MEHINFEGLGLSFDLNRVAIDFGFARIYWYAIFIITGVVISLILCKKDDGKYNINFDTILKLALIVLPISIICARVYFVLFKLDYYIQNPNQLLSINNGGLAIYGGIIGAAITIVVFCKIKKIKILDMFDYLIPFLALGQSIGRWGNFFNGEAHGVETTSFFRMGIFENGEYIQVHPTFLYESICTFIIFMVLYLYRNKRKFSGELTCLYFIMYGIARTVIEGLRTDSLMLGPLRISQILSIALVIISTIILIYKRVKK